MIFLHNPSLLLLISVGLHPGAASSRKSFPTGNNMLVTWRMHRGASLLSTTSKTYSALVHISKYCGRHRR